MSPLSELRPLAGLVLVLSIAYLRLDQFRHQKRVREYASERFREIGRQREVPKGADESRSYKALRNLAEIPASGGGNADGFPEQFRQWWDQVWTSQKWWSRVYVIAFRTRLDRLVSYVLLASGTIAVLAGNLHAVGRWQDFATEETWPIWWLVACGAASVLLALGGDWVVAGTKKNIDEYANEPMKLMQRKAEEGAVKDGHQDKSSS